MKEYRNRQGELHRLDGPAVIESDGSEHWYQNGERHRLDGPAVIWADGGKEWYQNGELHRLDGPAVIESDGSEQWWQNGELHRLDGPAAIWTDGSERWYQNGRLHRLDGPAVIWVDGREEWYQNGEPMSDAQIKLRRFMLAAQVLEVVDEKNSHKTVDNSPEFSHNTCVGWENGATHMQNIQRELYQGRTLMVNELAGYYIAGIFPGPNWEDPVVVSGEILEGSASTSVVSAMEDLDRLIARVRGA